MGAKRSAEMLNAIELRNAGATLATAAEQSGVTRQGLGFALRKMRKEAAPQASPVALLKRRGAQL
jgi:hypothetical protein